MISCLLVVLIDVRLDLLVYLMLVSLFAGLGLNRDSCILLLLSYGFSWLGL